MYNQQSYNQCFKSILQHPRLVTRLPQHFVAFHYDYDAIHKANIVSDDWRRVLLKQLLTYTRGRVYLNTTSYARFCVGFEDPADQTFAFLAIPELANPK